MTRPIVWALGAFGSIAIVASVAGDRLAAMTNRGSAPAAAPTRAPQGAANRPSTAAPGEYVVLADRGGHFSVDSTVDGEFMRMIVDTGATSVALREEDARRAGIRLDPADFRYATRTANGIVAVAAVRLRSLRIGGIEVRDVDAVVIPAGKLGTNLLGMSFLRRLKGFDISGGRLVMKG